MGQWQRLGVGAWNSYFDEHSIDLIVTPSQFADSPTYRERVCGQCWQRVAAVILLKEPGEHAEHDGVPIWLGQAYCPRAHAVQLALPGCGAARPAPHATHVPLPARG